MKIRYRIVEEISENRSWQAIGVIADWESDPPHIRLRGYLANGISAPIWRTIGERVDEQQLTLETYHLAFTGFDQYYRLLPEIHELEADSAAEIRRIIREKYVWVAQPITSEPTDSESARSEVVFA